MKTKKKKTDQNPTRSVLNYLAQNIRHLDYDEHANNNNQRIHLLRMCLPGSKMAAGRKKTESLLKNVEFS